MVYVDQSGKIEDTPRPTVIGFSNGNRGTIMLASKDKRFIQEIYRKENRPRVFVLHVFAILLFLTFKYHKLKRKVVVDREYSGKEAVILSYLTILSKTQKMDLPEIEFGLVGKSQQVHKLTNKAFRKKRADVIIDVREVLALAKKLTG